MLKIADMLTPARRIFLNQLESLGQSVRAANSPRPLNQCLLGQSSFNLSRIGVRSTSTQPKLPHLPVPALQETLDRYLKSIKPLLTNEEFENTINITKQFATSGGDGDKLYKLLQERANCMDNWLSDWWLKVAYLEFRWPVVIFSSPGLVFPMQKFNGIADQLAYTAKVITGAIEYKTVIDQDQLPAEKMGKEFLDMSQYHKVFGTCRIPGVKSDSLYYLDKSNPPKHILVIHNNHCFKVTVFGEKMEPLNEAQIICQLEEVIQKSQQTASPIGILTSENRDVWGKAYESLSKAEVNRKSLNEIATALFVVCIDNKSLSYMNPANEQSAAALRMTHGGGSRGNSANRWFDKTVQFVIGPEGHVGLTYEHSPAEGPPIAMLMDHIVKHVAKNNSGSPAEKTIPPEPLKFDISSEVKETICKAEQNLDKLVDDLHMIGFTFSSFGKNFIKSQKVSPDSFIQMALQLAFYRLQNEPGAHYESASLRRYVNGRTETIRSCSEESIHFAKTMLKDDVSAGEKKKALVQAINAHKEFTVTAMSFKAVDRPLLGLKLTALETGMEVPKFFSDVGYTRSCHFRLSTSQVAAKSDAFMCYGPLVADGYACCYNPRDNDIVFAVSSFRACAATDAAKFRTALETSLMDMHNVCLQADTKSKL